MLATLNLVALLSGAALATDAPISPWALPQSLPAETDPGRSPFGGERVVAGHNVSLARGQLSIDGKVVLEGVVGPPSLAGDAIAVAIASPPDHAALVVLRANDGFKPRTLATLPGYLDRVSLSPDAARVAYVTSHQGWATVFVRDALRPASNPVQVTNLNLTPVKGGLPDGFTPPPRTAPGFDRDALTWQGPNGPVRVTLPHEASP